MVSLESVAMYSIYVVKPHDYMALSMCEGLE